MNFGPDNFLTHVKETVMGGGRDSAGNPKLDSGFMVDHRNDLLGSSVLATSVTRVTDSDGFPALSAAALITAVANVGFTVPRDYDEETDTLVLRIVAKMAGATDTPTLTIDGEKRTLAAAPVAITPVSGSPTAALSTTAQAFELIYRGQGLVRGQDVQFTITSAAHGTDALQVQHIGVSYRSTLVSYNRTDSSDNDLR